MPTSQDPRPPRTPEARIEARFRLGVRSLGGIVEKLIPTRTGMPDRLVFFPGGRCSLVELKAGDGRLSPMQRHFFARAIAADVDVVVLSSFREVDIWLNRKAAELDVPRSVSGFSDNHAEPLATVEGHTLVRNPGAVSCSCGWASELGSVWAFQVPQWGAHLVQVAAASAAYDR